MDDAVDLRANDAKKPTRSQRNPLGTRKTRENRGRQYGTDPSCDPCEIVPTDIEDELADADVEPVEVLHLQMRDSELMFHCCQNPQDHHDVEVGKPQT